MSLSLTTEEWEYLEGHMENYKDVLLEDQEPFRSMAKDSTGAHFSEKLHHEMIPLFSINQEKTVTHNTATNLQGQTPLETFQITSFLLNTHQWTAYLILLKRNWPRLKGMSLKPTHPQNLRCQNTYLLLSKRN